jgi:hypothetical protein
LAEFGSSWVLLIPFVGHLGVRGSDSRDLWCENLYRPGRP